MSLVDSLAIWTADINSYVLPNVLLGLAVLGTVLSGLLAIVLIRAQARWQASQAAHTASGQGSILVDHRSRVIAINGPARKLLWPKLEAKQRAVLNASIRELLMDPAEQHHFVKFGDQRLVEIAISSADAGSRLFGIRGITVRDVTEQRRGQRHLVQLAHYDSLTGLGNRRLFVDRLEDALQRSAETGSPVALLYIDLDRFKEVNDTLGHGAGDALLRTLAKRLYDFLDGSEKALGGREVSIFRLAGDEFAIILTDVESVAVIESLARELLALIAEPMTLAERSISASGSVGIALYPEHADNVEDLVKNADSALYVAKDLGRARFVFYESSFSADADRSHKIEQELRNAISRRELALHYQPKVDVETDTVAGFEALLRWYNRELGFIGPKDFIPIAEERGMISEIGAWCIDETCRQIRVWQDAGFTTVPVSVNVSSAQFRDSDVERVISDALVKYEIHPSMLEIELTESLLLEDDDNTSTTLRDLRAIGVGVALDDFGTGYSALTYLNRFPLDVVKMDRGFLRDIEDSNAAAGIASAVISMSHSLGFKVVAEGVDSPPQAELLRSMGCDQIQGFLFSPAIPSEEASRFLASDRSPRPVVEPIIKLEAARSILGEDDPEAETPVRRLPDAISAEVVYPASAARVMVIDSQPSVLGATAFRMTRLGADVHLVTGLDEAELFVRQEEPVLDLLIAAPDADLARLASLVENVKKQATDHVPRLLIVGNEPGEERRVEIRNLGADWMLLEPYADPELRFFVNAARTNRNWKFQRQSVRVPMETIAWIRAGGLRGSGVVTSLSRRGAFIETQENYPTSKPIRIEFKVDESRISVFANVTRIVDGEEDAIVPTPSGIDVIFYEVDSVTDSAISEAVERLWSRFRP